MRRIATVFGAMVACTGLSVGSAGATTMQATGTLSCGATGTLELKPGIPGNTQVATPGWTKAKVHKAALDSCNNAGVTGGKASITDGVVVVNARLAQGASCNALTASLTNVSKIVAA